MRLPFSPRSAHRDVAGQEVQATVDTALYTPIPLAAPMRRNFNSLTDRAPSAILEEAKIYGEAVSKAEPIHGNIYTYWAFLNVLERHELIHSGAGRSKVLQVGLVTVMIAQILSPVAVLVWSIYAINWSDAKIGLGNWEYIPGSYHKGVSNFASHLLGTLFLFIFILNGIYVIRDDKKTAEKIWYMVQSLDEKKGAKVDRYWLRAGAIINSWCVVISVICMGPCFTISKSPKDVIFDAFALLFLFRLDDVTGDLGFLDDQWDSDVFGAFYEHIRMKEEIVRQQTLEQQGTLEDLDIDSDDAGWSDIDPDQSCIPGCTIYRIARTILTFLLVVMPLAFVFIEGAVPRRETERVEEHEVDWKLMKQNMDAMQTQLAAVTAELARVRGVNAMPAPTR